MTPNIDNLILELRLLSEFGPDIHAADRYRIAAQLQQELADRLAQASDRRLAAILTPIAEAGPDRLGQAIGQAALRWREAATATA